VIALQSKGSWFDPRPPSMSLSNLICVISYWELKVGVQCTKLPKKKQSEGVQFCIISTQNTVPCCQKCTPTDCFL